MEAGNGPSAFQNGGEWTLGNGAKMEGNGQIIPDRRSGFHSDTRDPKYGIMLCHAENEIARTKTALKLLGLAPWKNTYLLGTSNLISFLLAPTDGVPSRWSKKIGDYDKEDDHCSNDYLGFTGTLVVFGLDEKSI